MATIMPPPAATEAADYYFTYINKVPPGDIRATLEAQTADCLTLFDGISDADSMQRYAEGKWSLRGVLGHINDCERMFVFRALWFARGFDTALPSFDETTAAAHDGADGRSWHSHVDEFTSVRGSTLAFFRHLPDEAWMRRGTASGNSFTVNALAYIAAGHVAHHLALVRERYLKK